MILFKKLKFFHVVCLSKKHCEKLFADVLHKKEGLKDYKNICLLKMKIRIFAKGLIHRFGQKFKFSWTLIFLQKVCKYVLCVRCHHFHCCHHCHCCRCCHCCCCCHCCRCFHCCHCCHRCHLLSLLSLLHCVTIVNVVTVVTVAPL